VLGERLAEIVRNYRPSIPDPANTGVGKREQIRSGYVWMQRALLCEGFLISLHRIKRKKEKNMEASVAIQTLPGVSDDDELCRIVDEVIAYIAGTGYNYFVGPFETTIEGPYDELMEIVRECQHIAIRAGAPSVAAYIKVSYKPEGEVLSIERKIGKYQG
jgi:uncharacterized protein YqgV (UPF0045/DUF77 family)